MSFSTLNVTTLTCEAMTSLRAWLSGVGFVCGGCTLCKTELPWLPYIVEFISRYCLKVGIAISVRKEDNDTPQGVGYQGDQGHGARSGGRSSGRQGCNNEGLR